MVAAALNTLPITWELLPKLFFGDSNDGGNSTMSFEGLRHFADRTMELIQGQANSASCVGLTLEEAGPECIFEGALLSQGSEQREIGKVAFASLIRANMWIPTLAGALYVAFVFYGPKVVKSPLPLKHVLSAWNLGLAVFSAVGSYHCMGALSRNLFAHGYRYTVCQLPQKIDMQGFDLDIWCAAAAAAALLANGSPPPPQWRRWRVRSCAR